MATASEAGTFLSATQRDELGHWPTVHRHGHAFTTLNASQHLADRIPQFPNGDRTAHHAIVALVPTYVHIRSPCGDGHQPRSLIFVKEPLTHFPSRSGRLIGQLDKVRPGAMQRLLDEEDVARGRPATSSPTPSGRRAAVRPEAEYRAVRVSTAGSGEREAAGAGEGGPRRMPAPRPPIHFRSAPGTPVGHRPVSASMVSRTRTSSRMPNAAEVVASGFDHTQHPVHPPLTSPSARGSCLPPTSGAPPDWSRCCLRD